MSSTGLFAPQPWQAPDSQPAHAAQNQVAQLQARIQQLEHSLANQATSHPQITDEVEM